MEKGILPNSIDIEKMYELLEDTVDEEGDVLTERDLDLFKALFINLAVELGNQRHHLVGLALRIQGEVDCFFDEHREVGVLGDPGWLPNQDDSTRYDSDMDCYGRGGMEFKVYVDEVIHLKKRQVKSILHPRFELSIRAVSFYFDDRNHGKMAPFRCPIIKN